MNERKKLLRDLKGLGESIRLDWADLASLNLSSSDQLKIRKHIAICVKDMMDLLERLESEPDPDAAAQ